ncbi:MAG: hypothetical protein K2P51_05030 [Rhabdochlamydiaceae bacterium]|nr:hypothetical protein [Rhabdochlamydiaceae bacterium]
MTSLRISSPNEEGVLQVSKWLKYQVLLSQQEMKGLLEALKPLFIAVGSEPVTLDNALIAPEEFLRIYAGYVQALIAGSLPEDKLLRRTFSSLFTQDLEALYAMPVGKDKFLIKSIRPVIQLQAHQFFYSTLDGKFHPMVLGKESVLWGIQFAYPQLCQDPRTKRIAKVEMSSEFPNTALFSRLTRWMRDHTMPTPFVVNEVRTQAPIRIGRECLVWIESHPQLKQKGIHVIPVGQPCK